MRKDLNIIMTYSLSLDLIRLLRVVFSSQHLYAEGVITTRGNRINFRPIYSLVFWIRAATTNNRDFWTNWNTERRVEVRRVVKLFLTNTVSDTWYLFSSLTKWFWKEKLMMQNWAVFHLISKHSWISFLFSLRVWEV